MLTREVRSVPALSSQRASAGAGRSQRSKVAGHPVIQGETNLPLATEAAGDGGETEKALSEEWAPRVWQA
ncbi:hypothetical protein HispidOSU_004904 [Sigmodon hispidus]